MEYGENREKRYSSVRGGCQRGVGTEEIGEKPKSSVRGGSRGCVGTEEMREKPKSPYNLFGVGGGVRRETGNKKFLRTWWALGRFGYGGNWLKAKISVQLVWIIVGTFFPTIINIEIRMV